MGDKITVHIADDHQILIDGIIAVLNFEKNIEVKNVLSNSFGFGGNNSSLIFSEL